MKVSVIVPAYNQAAYLPACLDSLWFQDHGDLEIIVVNDYSTDSTTQVLRNYESGFVSAEASFASRYDTVTGELERVRHPREGRHLRGISHPANRSLTATASP